MSVSFSEGTVGGVDDEQQDSPMPPSSDAFAITCASMLAGLSSRTSLDDIAKLAIPRDLLADIRKSGKQGTDDKGALVLDADEAQTTKPADAVPQPPVSVPQPPSTRRARALNGRKLATGTPNESVSEPEGPAARGPTWLRHNIGSEEQRKNLAKKLMKLESALSRAEANLSPPEGGVNSHDKWIELKKNLARSIRISASERVHEIANAAAAASILKHRIVEEKVSSEKVKEVAKVAIEASALLRKKLQDTSAAYTFTKSAHLRVVRPPSGRSLSSENRAALTEFMSVPDVPSKLDTSTPGRTVLPGIQETGSVIHPSLDSGPPPKSDNIQQVPHRETPPPLRAWQRRPQTLLSGSEPSPLVPSANAKANAIVANALRTIERMTSSSGESLDDNSILEPEPILVPVVMMLTGATRFLVYRNQLQNRPVVLGGLPPISG